MGTLKKYNKNPVSGIVIMFGKIYYMESSVYVNVLLEIFLKKS